MRKYRKINQIIVDSFPIKKYIVYMESGLAQLKPKEDYKMKIIANTYENKEHGFSVTVTTCNKRIVTAERTDTAEIVKFNRAKFEWMINKGIFVLSA